MRNKGKIVLVLSLGFAVFLLFHVSSFATTITSWNDVKSTPDYEGTQVDAAAAGKSANGIVWTRHNLSSYGSPLQPAIATGSWPTFTFSAVTTEICVFCHTPHFARTDTAPLWNRGSAATGYVAYGTTLGGTNITSVSGSSLACLSCHDGITTFDNLINRPGKGSNTTGTGSDQGWGFLMAETTFGLEHFSGSACGTCHPQDESDRLNIGRPISGTTADLSNDHPINVQYQSDRASLRDSGTVLNDIQMNQARSFNDDTTQDGYGKSNNLWAVKGYISDTATIDDLLRDGGKVQCTSCHDPHYKNQTNNDPAVVDSYDRTDGGTGYNYDVTSPSDPLIDGLFLRRVGGNSNSGLCRTCHNK